MDRLDAVDLSHLLLDLFAADGSRRFVSEQLREVLERQQQIAAPDVSRLHYNLLYARNRLVVHKDALFRPEHGWGISIYDLRAESAGIPLPAQTTLRLPDTVFKSWTNTSLEEYSSAFDELYGIGALQPEWRSYPGWHPESMISLGAAQVLRNKALDLQTQVTSLKQPVETEAQLAGYAVPTSWEQVVWLAKLHSDINYIESLAPNLLNTPDIDAMLAALSKKYREELKDISWGERRKAKKHVKNLLYRVPENKRISLLTLSRDVRKRWLAGGSPTAAPNAVTIYQQVVDAENSIKTLDANTQGMSLSTKTPDALRATLTSLIGDQRIASMVRAYELETKLRLAGLEQVVDMLLGHFAAGHAIAATPGDILRWVSIRSVLDPAELTQGLAGIRGEELNQAVGQFKELDVEHLRANTARVRRKAAEYIKQACDNYPNQHALLKTEVTRKRNFRPIRRLFQEAPQVLFAVKPVWAMSPLQVSRLLPPKQCFDVVIFDEASQIKPADAIPAIMRGKQVIVAGDSRQLPPTEFFTKVLEDDPDEESDDSIELLGPGSATHHQAASSNGSYTRDAESILFAVDRLLAGQSRTLQWHYRSRDERLIAVSNRHIYNNSLTTFPAVDALEAIRHVEVPPSLGIKGGTNSPEQEVACVVEEVRQYVLAHPDNSVGVITFGVKHEARVEQAIDRAIQADPEFERALNSNTNEPWFVKAIERVQGDERDAIFLTLGYGKSMDGRLKYFWGPLLQEGGERRLNVAISRAKKHMTLITSFSCDDVAPDGHQSAGFRLMYHFIRFMSSGGSSINDGIVNTVPLNPFEIDIKTRLEAAGLALDSQVGVGNYRIDFAVRHPTRPGRHVLALEADGASYHSGHTARERDRLRQTMLENRGWKFHRIWSTDWFNNADKEVQKVIEAFQDAVLEYDSGMQRTQQTSGSNQIWSEGTTQRKLPRPNFFRYDTITDYSMQTLVQIIQYIRSDGILRSATEEQRLMLAELGFSKLGSRIQAVITRAQAIADCQTS